MISLEPLVLDNTIRSDKQRCSRLCQLRHDLSHVPKKVSTPLVFGGATHLGWGAYYDDHRDPASAVAAFHRAYAQFDGVDDKRTLAKGYEILTSYHTQFQDEPWEDKGGELYFSLPIGEVEVFGKHYPVVYAGLIDRIGKFNGDWTINEFKTSSMPKDFVIKPNHQITGYAWAARQLIGEPFNNALVTIAGIYKGSSNGFFKSRAKNDAGQEVGQISIFRREYTGRTQEDFDRFTKNLLYVAREIITCKLAFGDSPWPENDNNCTTKFGKCAYFPVCSVPFPVQEMVLSNFYIIDPWEPGKRPPSLIPQGVELEVGDE